MGLSCRVVIRERANVQPKIVARVLVNREKREISTNESCPVAFWDEKLEKVRKGFPGYDKINLRITKLKTKIGQVFITMQGINDYSLKDFNRLMEGEQISKEDFFAWAERELTQIGPFVKNTYIIRYKVVVRKLKAFRSNITFADINEKLVEDFHRYLITDCKNATNTITGNLKLFRSLMQRAIQQGLIFNDPFKFTKMKTTPTNRVFLLVDELKLLEKLFFDNEFSGGVENVTRNFLFCCYTGVRYGDLKDLTWDDIQSGMLAFRMNKTQGIARIPLSEKAIKLLPERKGNKVFRVPSNQVTNKFLKVMASQAGIEKEISSHTARHTFATIGITLGIPIEVISKVLGHSSLSITQVYAKIIDEVKVREMKKFDLL